MATKRSIRINNEEMRRVLQAKGGPIDKRMGPIQQRVLRRAQELAPKKSGQLASSIRAQAPVRFSTETVYFVGSDDRKIFWIHEGTEEHDIPLVARKPGERRISFYWPRIGGTFVTPSRRWPRGQVSHPGISLNPVSGNKGVQPFLTQARDEVVRAELGNVRKGPSRGGRR